MAFNFVHHFRKYQKVWMAGLVLVSMVTFVLCTGVGGDLSEMLLTYFQRRAGSVSVKVDGRSYKSFDISDLKTQRSLANEFMKKASEYYIKGIDGFLLEISKDPKKVKDEDRKVILPRMQLFKEELAVRAKKRWYFDSGTRLEELADFLMWKAQADRLGIYLVDEHVREMMRSELLQPALVHFSGMQIPTDLGWLTFELRREFPKTNEATLFRALEDEFRVRMAQLAILNAQPDAYRDRAQGAEQVKIQFFQALENPGYRHVMDTRAVATPEQMWEMFKKKRAEFDVALVPVPVEQFIKDIKDPTEQELQLFFNDHKKLKYDPTSDKPGFEIPHRVKVEWVTADPESEFYKKLAKTALALEVTPPVLSSQSPLAAAVRYALGRMPLDVTLYEDFKRHRSRAPHYLAAWLTDTDVMAPILDKLYKPTPASVAALVGSTFRDDLFAAAVVSYRVPIFEKHKKELPAILAAEANARSPIYATMISSAAGGSPFQSLLQYELAGRLPQFMPIDVAREDLIDFAEKKIASRWINKNMLDVKKVLENPRIIGKPREVFEDKLLPLIEKYGLTRGASKDFIDRFTAGKAKELTPLKEAWERSTTDINTMEGRGGTERALKDEEFYRMFFDTAESFSTGVVLFDARAWPPIVKVKDARGFYDPTSQPKTISLFEMSEKPFLFWKAADEPASPAESLAQPGVREKVERAWKIEKARQQFALPQAKEIAERLQKETGVLGPVVHSEAKKLGKDPIFLNNLAPMVRMPTHFGPKTIDYGEYQLPRDVMDYPRDDTVKHLLGLTELKEEPIKIDNTELDALNKKLWETKKNAPAKESLLRNVQVVTNKPRTVLYVATVSVPPHANKADFDDAFKQAVGLFGGPYNAFVRRAHDQLTKDYRQNIIAQLRTDSGWWIDQSEVKHFDQDTAP